MTLRYRRLLLENTGPINEAEIPLDKQGFVLLTGRNELTGGNNGSGKSTPWNILQHLQDGSSSKKLKPEHIINRHRRDLGYFAQADLRKDGHEYMLQRFAKSPKWGTGIKLIEDGNDITAKGIRRAEAQIRDVIGLSQQEYLNTVYLTGGYTHTLIAGTPSEKDAYLTRLFQLNIYDLMLETVKNDLDELREEIGEDQEKLYEWKILKKELKALPKPDDSKREALEKEQARYEKTLKKLEKKYHRLIKAAEAYKSREKVEAEIKELDYKPERTVEDLSKAIDKYEKLLHDAEKAAMHAKQRARLKEKLKALPRVKDSLGDLKERIHKFEEDLRRYNKLLPDANLRADAKEEYREVEKEYSKALDKYGPVHQEGDNKSKYEEALSTIRGLLQSYKDRVHELRKVKSGECPTCGHEIKDVRALRKEFEKRIKTFRKSEKISRKKLAVAKEMDDLRDRLDELAKRIKRMPKADPKKVEKKIRKLGKLIAALQEEVRAAERRQEYEQELAELPKVHDHGEDRDTLKKKLRHYRDEYEKAKSHARLTKLLKDLPEVGPSTSKVKKYESKIEKTKNRIYKLDREIDAYRDATQTYRDKRHQFEKLGKAVVKIRAKKTKEEALTGLTQAFGRNGLRIGALKHITKVVAEALPLYVRLLFCEQNLNMTVTEKEGSFDFELYRKKEFIPLNVLSRGERARLSLALLLTTRRASPAAKHTNLLVIDEVLDAIDTQGHEGVIKTLRHMLDHTGVTTCILVTQNPELAKVKRKAFDQIWTVTKSRPGKSVLTFR